MLVSKTEHTVLDGSLVLNQPASGYRAAIDPVLLAASVVARAGDRILDLGTGIGTAALCLAKRCPDVQIVGLELQSELVQLARENAEHNNLCALVDIQEGDINSPPEILVDATFDQVIANPPYYRADQAQVSPNQIKAVANVEGAGGLEVWVATARRFLKEGGVLTIIHTADRLADLIDVVGSHHFGSIEIMPFWPKQGRPAKRVIVRCRKGGKAATVLHGGLVLHNADGGFTDDADKILKQSVQLEF
jgi:tRNA1(Val) A37 N6-methylase TrmN6